MANPVTRQENQSSGLFSVFSDTAQSRVHIAGLSVITSVTFFVVGSAYLDGRVTSEHLSILADLLGLISP